MGFQEFLEKFKLIDFQNQIKASIKAKQWGLININVENKTYNIILKDSESLEKFASASISPELESAIKRRASEKLKGLASSLELLPETTSSAVVTSTLASSAMELITAAESIKIDGPVKIKMD